MYQTNPDADTGKMTDGGGGNFYNRSDNPYDIKKAPLG
jgi:hypothetical protein